LPIYTVLSFEAVPAYKLCHETWYNHKIAKECKGDTFLVVYADDFLAGFEHKEEAEQYYRELKERMAAFNLELEESKSRMRESCTYGSVKGRCREAFVYSIIQN